MKKWLVLVSAFLLLFATACNQSAPSTAREIKSVSIDGRTYLPLYLFKFSNAEATGSDGAVKNDAPKEGYVISEDKYAKELNAYTNDGIRLKSSDFELIQEFPITIERTTDTYVISFYNYKANGFSGVYLSDADKIDEYLTPRHLEVIKEKALIEYYD